MLNLIYILMSLTALSQELHIQSSGDYYSLEVIDGEKVRPLGDGHYSRDVLAHVMESYGFKPPFDLPAAIFKATAGALVLAPIAIAGLSKLTTKSWILGFEYIGGHNFVAGELIALVIGTASLFAHQPLPNIDHLHKARSRFNNFSEFERDLLSRLHDGCLALISQPQQQPK